MLLKNNLLRHVRLTPGEELPHRRAAKPGAQRSQDLGWQKGSLCEVWRGSVGEALLAWAFRGRGLL